MLAKISFRYMTKHRLYIFGTIIACNIYSAVSLIIRDTHLRLINESKRIPL